MAGGKAHRRRGTGVDPKEKDATAQLLVFPRQVQSPGYSPPCAHNHSHLKGPANMGTHKLTKAAASTLALTQGTEAQCRKSSE